MIYMLFLIELLIFCLTKSKKNVNKPGGYPESDILFFSVFGEVMDKFKKSSLFFEGIIIEMCCSTKFAQKTQKNVTCRVPH